MAASRAAMRKMGSADHHPTLMAGLDPAIQHDARSHFG
jgi:hypothetical protein